MKLTTILALLVSLTLLYLYDVKSERWTNVTGINVLGAFLSAIGFMGTVGALTEPPEL